MAHKKLDKNTALFIKTHIENIQTSLKKLTAFSLTLFDSGTLNIKAKHGNFWGDSLIFSIKIKFILTEESIQPPYDYVKFLQKLTPKLIIKYKYAGGLGDLIFESHEIEIVDDEQLVRVNYLLHHKPGYPSHFKIEDKPTFLKLKKVLRQAYRASGFKQKSAIIKQTANIES